jgi:hypothetical protein
LGKLLRHEAAATVFLSHAPAIAHYQSLPTFGRHVAPPASAAATAIEISLNGRRVSRDNSFLLRSRVAPQVELGVRTCRICKGRCSLLWTRDGFEMKFPANIVHGQWTRHSSLQGCLDKRIRQKAAGEAGNALLNAGSRKNRKASTWTKERRKRDAQ